MRKFFVIILLVLPVWSIQAGIEPFKVSSTTDGIVISAMAQRESDGRTLVTSRITNQSKHILATGVPINKSLCFRFNLLSNDGTTISMDSEADFFPLKR